MGAHIQPGKPGPTVDEINDQEVLRANRELAAYFKGRRTEREARAALKIIKSFLRERERTDPARRRPLPGLGPSKRPSPAHAAKSSARPAKVRRRRRRAEPVTSTPAVPTPPREAGTERPE